MLFAIELCRVTDSNLSKHLTKKKKQIINITTTVCLFFLQFLGINGGYIPLYFIKKCLTKQLSYIRISVPHEEATNKYKKPI